MSWTNELVIEAASEVLGIPASVLASLRAGEMVAVPRHCDYLPEKRAYRVVLLASYCGDDDPSCAPDLPCIECLKMCNIFSFADGMKRSDGSWQYQRDLLAAAQPRRDEGNGDG